MQIAQSGMNMDKDRHMLMVEDNIGNPFRPNVVRNVRNQVVQNAVQNPGVQNVGNFKGLSVDPGIANQYGIGNVVTTRAEANEAWIKLTFEEFDFMAAIGACEETKRENANCTLENNLQQASTTGTQSDKAPVYDSDKSAEVHLSKTCYDNDIFNMFTQEEQYTELLEPIPKPHQVQQNDSNVISVVSSMEQGGGTVEQHSAPVEETRAYHESLFHNIAAKVEKVNSVNRKLKATNAELTTELARYKNQEKCFEIRADITTKTRRPHSRSNIKNDRVPSVSKNQEVAFRRNPCFVRNLKGVDLLKENRTTNLYNINLHDMASGSPICLTAQATSTKSWLWHQWLSHLNFDTINDLARNNLVTGLPKFKYQKELFTILLDLPEDIYVAVDSYETAQEIWLHVQQMMKDSDIGIQEKKAKLKIDVTASRFNRDTVVKVNILNNGMGADESLAKHKALELEIERLLRAVASQDIMSIVQNNSVVDTSNLQTELERSERKDTTKGTSVNTHICKQSILGKPPSSSGSKLYSVTPFPKYKGFPKIDESYSLSKPVTSNLVPTPTESKVVKNDNVIFLGIFRMNPFKAFRVDNFVPNKHVKASVRTKSITVSQPYVITKNDVNSKTNGFSPKDVKSITRTRRPLPRNNPKNDKVPSRSKSSCLSNNLDKIEENHRNLQSSSNQKHMSSKCNNIKLAIWNAKSEVVCVMNGNAPIVTKTIDGKETVIPPTSVEKKAQRRAELKARSTLLMAFLD
ncbi:retrovirus-related pol polyprotein from transposon TNT 1-94 [Tanacetum coccineum]